MAARLSYFLLLGASALASPLVARQPSTTTSATAPASSAWAWDAGAVHEYTIHDSCNSTQRAYIAQGLEEALTLTRHARDHILRWGNSSEFYQKYFGDTPTGEPIGWLTKIADSDKGGITFRCDNIDGNCANKGWGGHWRGSNATSETVICDLSYETRLPLHGLCMFGYDVANGPLNFYWASDLMHRLLHLPAVGEGIVEHYAEDYPGFLELARSNTTYAVISSDNYQYFALDVYAHDIAVPGVGCPGVYTATEKDSHASTSSTSASSAATYASATPTVAATTTTEAVTTTAATTTDAVASPAETTASQACTPHDDHWHCPPGVPEPTYPPA